MRRVATLAVVAVIALVSSACLALPGNIDSIQLVSSTTSNGWKYDYYRNTAYACSVSGYQTFVVGTKIGSSDTAPAPLWTFLHGGGAGYFDTNGNPVPNANQKVEEPADSLNQKLTNNGLMSDVREDPAGFRTLAVSYCSHDVYLGFNSPDPHNPNTTPDGKLRTTNGLISVKAAVQFVQAKYPTTKYFLHGGSAGSAGSYYVARALEIQGIPPAGVVADASVINVEAMQAGYAAGICADDNDPARGAAIAARVDPENANVNNEIDKMVSRGWMKVPLLQIWNHGDVNTCGSPPVACPMRDGTTVTLGMTDCIHEPLRRAIAAEGPGSKSLNLPVCVDADPVKDCSVHVVTTRPHPMNTDPATPADFFPTIMSWVHARLADA